LGVAFGGAIDGSEARTMFRTFSRQLVVGVGLAAAAMATHGAHAQEAAQDAALTVELNALQPS